MISPQYKSELYDTLTNNKTKNHVSPNIHENPKPQINKHKVMILSKIHNLNKKSRPIMPKANKPQKPNLQ